MSSCVVGFLLVVLVAGVSLSVSESSISCRSEDPLEITFAATRQAVETDTVYFTKHGVTICTKRHCGVIPEEKMLCSYPFTFTSVKTYTKKTGLHYYKKMKTIPERGQTESSKGRKKRGDECNVLPVGDGDYCCPTHLYATYYLKEMDNTEDEACVIIHLPYLRNFQMVTEGICGPCGSCNADPSKSCQQMYTVQSLLAWNKVKHKLRFEMFNIPTYCSCINGN
ncbi:uncharacterized protein LOC123527927 [Mercenaria mercenaria]|uniref:uncharacterized protein LOC123527927 n=1 Tax=Mercenaria mercenaria TaxID=6596 RepID=UPI00234EA00A|nr:uncharacterized protein LOC123527927 [Mercenaria mercenaria]